MLRANPLGLSRGELRFVRVRAGLFALRIAVVVAVLMLFIAYGVISV